MYKALTLDRINLLVVTSVSCRNVFELCFSASEVSSSRINHNCEGRQAGTLGGRRHELRVHGEAMADERTRGYGGTWRHVSSVVWFVAIYRPLAPNPAAM